MSSLKTHKKGFTLVEVIIVCTLFAVMVIGVILAVNRAYIFLDNTRLSVRASNLARGGVEMMYNLRDSNRRLQSGERDKYWANTGKRKSDGTLDANNLAAGVYAIKEGITNDKERYVYLENLNVSDDDFYDEIETFFSDTYKTARSKSEISFTGQYSYLSGSKMATGNLSDLLGTSGLKFYRIVRVYGIYCKNTNNTDDTSCTNDSDPKELRFCVKVFYISGGEHSVELCSVMTNFQE